MPEWVTDTFPYADGALETVSGGKWTKLTGSTSSVQVTTGQAGGSGNEAGQMITTWPGSTTLQYTEAVWISGQFGGPTIFCAQTYSFYLGELIAFGGCKLYKVIGGAFTQIATTATDPVSGHVYRLYMSVAGTLTLADNGTDFLTLTSETSLTTGVPGIRCWGTVLDNWAAGDFSVGGAGRNRARPFPFKPGSPR